MAAILLLQMKPKNSRRTSLLLQTLIAVLCLTPGCSSSKSTPSAGSNTGSGSFTNANFKGNYTYTLGGSFFGLSSGNGAFQRAGTFVADGAGQISNGSDDLIQGSTLVTTNPFTGSYAVANDGTGLVVMNIAGVQINLAMTIINSSRVLLMEMDSFASGSGGALLQNSSALSSSPNGAFIFRFHGYEPNVPSSGSISCVGQMNFNSGNISGYEDIVRFGILRSPTISGSLTAPDSTGRGMISLVESSGFTSSYLYYIVDSQTLVLMGADLVHLGIGRAVEQSGSSFTNSSLSGGFVFSSTGDTQTSVFGVTSAGVFTADGNGNITQGSYDSVSDGSPVKSALTGTYSVSSQGRVLLTLDPAGASPIPEVAWIISPSRAFFLVDVLGLAQDGSMNQQSSGSFSTSSVKGQYTFSMFGHDSMNAPLVNRLGVMNFDGSGKLSLPDYFVNRSGSRRQTNAPTTSYTVTPDGRLSASIPGITNELVVYLISNSGGSNNGIDSGELLLGDTGDEVSGGISTQVSP